MLLDLAVVMPVYNEEACIADVVKSWHSVLSRLNITFRVIILNDGSSDGTTAALGIFTDDPTIDVINKSNSGHGPTILLGYQKALALANWVFQCDSDDEMKAEYFPSLWEKRGQFDALFGVRKDRSANLSRKIITNCSRITVRVLFGGGVTDVNTPYRLIRANILRQIVNQIPADTFAPNVIISGALSKAGSRIHEQPVPHHNRKTGEVSIVKWRLWKAAVKSLWQTLYCRPLITAMDDNTTKV